MQFDNLCANMVGPYGLPVSLCDTHVLTDLHRIPEAVAETYRQANLLGATRESPLHLAPWLTHALRAEHSDTLSAGLPN